MNNKTKNQLIKEIDDWIVDNSDGCMGNYGTNLEHIEKIFNKHLLNKEMKVYVFATSERDLKWIHNGKTLYRDGDEGYEITANSEEEAIKLLKDSTNPSIFYKITEIREFKKGITCEFEILPY